MLSVLIRIASMNIQFHDKKFSLNICFLELLEEFRMDSKTSSKAIVNEPSVFEPSRFDCMVLSVNAFLQSLGD